MAIGGSSVTRSMDTATGVLAAVRAFASTPSREFDMAEVAAEMGLSLSQGGADYQRLGRKLRQLEAQGHLTKRGRTRWTAGPEPLVPEAFGLTVAIRDAACAAMIESGGYGFPGMIAKAVGAEEGSARAILGRLPVEDGRIIAGSHLSGAPPVWRLRDDLRLANPLGGRWIDLESRWRRGEGVSRRALATCQRIGRGLRDVRSDAGLTPEEVTGSEVGAALRGCIMGDPATADWFAGVGAERGEDDGAALAWTVLETVGRGQPRLAHILTASFWRHAGRRFGVDGALLSRGGVSPVLS